MQRFQKICRKIVQFYVSQICPQSFVSNRYTRSFRNSKIIVTESQVRYSQNTITTASVGFEI